MGRAVPKLGNCLVVMDDETGELYDVMCKGELVFCTGDPSVGIPKSDVRVLDFSQDPKTGIVLVTVQLTNGRIATVPYGMLHSTFYNLKLGFDWCHIYLDDCMAELEQYKRNKL